MPWNYVGQQTQFGQGFVFFQALLPPGSLLRIEIPFVPDQYARQWGVALTWTDGSQWPGTGLLFLERTKVLYNKRNLYRLESPPVGQARLAVYITKGAKLPPQDVIVNRWIS